MDWPHIAPLLTAFALPLALSWVFTALHIRAAQDFGLIDLPSERKFHQKPTPTGAGAAIFAAVTLSALFLSTVCGLDWTTWNVQFLIGGLIVAFGLLDDHRMLAWQLRLLVQGLAALAAIRSIFNQAPWEPNLIGFAVWLVVMINAFNFVDNMDGLSAGITLAIAACLAIAQGRLQDPFQSLPAYRNVGFNTWHLVMLMGALTGFLWYNRPPARVFMGDAGSTFLGFFLGLASVPLFLDGEETPRLSADWLAPMCMFALPIYDLVSVATLRVWQQRGLFVSDRNNLSHRLVALGMRPTRAVALLWLLAVVGGVGGLLLYVVPNPAKMILGAAQLAGWWVALPVVEYLAQRRLATLRRSVKQPNASAKRR
jgi:UDP-GlcNAc:undecaprenyl-phosphate GlcNAc-1-phosphate transferase